MVLVLPYFLEDDLQDEVVSWTESLMEKVAFCAIALLTKSNTYVPQPITNYENILSKQKNGPVSKERLG